MGMHDRDYYREDYARKQGMRYDAKTAKYFAAQPSRARAAPAARPASKPPSRPARPVVKAGFRWTLQVLLFLAIVSFVVAAVAFASSFGRKAAKPESGRSVPARQVVT